MKKYLNELKKAFSGKIGWIMLGALAVAILAFVIFYVRGHFSAEMSDGYIFYSFWS